MVDCAAIFLGFRMVNKISGLEISALARMLCPTLQEVLKDPIRTTTEKVWLLCGPDKMMIPSGAD